MICPRFPLIWLFDANLTLGNLTSTAVGNRHPEKQGTHGPLFHDERLRLDVCLPALFPRIQVDQAHGSAKQARTSVSITWLFRKTGFAMSKALESATTLHLPWRIDWIIGCREWT